MLIDTHCHLNDERLLPEADNIVKSLKADNIEAVINVGYDFPSSLKSIELANTYNEVYATVGIHPHDAKTRKQSDYDWFAKAVTDNKVVAIGEIGLDYFYDLSPRDIQKKVFVEQLELAYSLKMPISVHLRDAYGDMLELVRENKDKLVYGGVLHCYSGSAEMLKEFLKYGFYFAYGGPLTYKNAKQAIQSITATPLDKLMFETDSPYLAPVPLRGETNVPNNVKYVAEKASELLGINIDKLTEITTNNAKTLFKRLK